MDVQSLTPQTALRLAQLSTLLTLGRGYKLNRTAADPYVSASRHLLNQGVYLTNDETVDPATGQVECVSEAGRHTRRLLDDLVQAGVQLDAGELREVTTTNDATLHQRLCRGRYSRGPKEATTIIKLLDRAALYAVIQGVTGHADWTWYDADVADMQPRLGWVLIRRDDQRAAFGRRGASGQGAYLMSLEPYGPILHVPGQASSIREARTRLTGGARQL